MGCEQEVQVMKIKARYRHRVAYTHDITEDRVFNYLTKIHDNDGFVTDVPEKIKNFIVPELATFDVSTYSGLITQWHLTSAGLREYRRIFGERRKTKLTRTEKNRGRNTEEQYSYHDGPVVSLTIEVLDALKAIMTTGEPQTEKMVILSRIQLGGYAKCENGIWTITHSGRYQANNHIRKSECAQFSGKVR
jgi:hypothetical protein